MVLGCHLLPPHHLVEGTLSLVLLTPHAPTPFRAGKQARNAAKELLRMFGRAGTTAFRTANTTMYPRPHPTQVGRWGNGYGAAPGAVPGYGVSSYDNPGFNTMAPAVGAGGGEGARAGGRLCVCLRARS